MQETGRITSLPLPDLSVCGRDAVLDYFDNSWALQEILFAGLQTSEAFYRPPAHNLRHPMIFYYGHPAALYINKLRVSGLLSGPVNAYLEHVLETGVDEMSWDDLSKNDMLWPSVGEVHSYRAEVYRIVRGIIESTPFAPDLGRPVTMDDQAWAIFLTFEHDRIHLETSSMLIRELPLKLVQHPSAWPAPAPMRRVGDAGGPTPESVPDNRTVAVPGGRVRLGKPWSFPSFGWDNEYGTRELDVADFEASRYLVSNGEYHRFVADGGYRRPELWSEEGWGWRAFRNAKWPQFWVPDGPSGLHRYRLRTTFEVIDMPWDWPVCVNYHEAKAYCAWRAERDGRAYRLPTEAEFRCMRALPDEPAVDDDPVMRLSGAHLRAQGVNLNLAWGSETPVDHSPATAHGVHDSAGNLWTWCEDTFNPLDDFAVHPYYEDFSTPCFDGLHQMILGGSFVSTGDEASIWARFHFRPHFLQQSGIRLIASPDPATSTEAPDTYNTQEMLNRYLLMHFASVQETFGRPDHPLAVAHAYPQRLARMLTREAERIGVSLHRVLDAGCAVGGASFTLAESTVTSVVGADLSSTFIETARKLARGEAVPYERLDQGEVRTRLHARAPRPAGGADVDFVIADCCALPETLGSFDAVLLSNLLDRVADPRACLRQFTDSDRVLRSGGLLLVASPWSWQPAYTAPDKWLGARSQSPTSEYEIRRILDEAFDLVAESDEPGMLRDHRRHYEYLSADVSLWRKR
ncbi:MULTISPECIES: 5-histidylcysteine sulfoxide synthase [Streptosporangium]|uniref:5-histidylcysteine sulfoxide synthase n=1 Tax=Streptosporangium brasiliense TaxID=47480 RepID=A0ABT9RPT9_9ACTN|nr:5-histidylcysteine sulfoxide synthase [Streptosporangium brasiliense]MDP9870290.1 5-histidylcysteine sulfoxide synthase [Streptosporangium brasiliense]